MPDFQGFEKTLTFLQDLSFNNKREWFQSQKPRYESDFITPALSFIESMTPHIHAISPHFTAIAKKQGGSLMRIYRDTRFSKNRAPYKLNVGIHFRHDQGKDIHAPGLYVHIQPGNSFVGAGIWRPEPKTLRKIRDFIVDNPRSYKHAIQNKAFSESFHMSGDSLIRPPRGFDPEHALIEELKRKDFIAICHLSDAEVTKSSLPELAYQKLKVTEPLIGYLCTAIEANY
ncbi:DUF2461 domain-containing protein [Dongshaea marina]|uniref:DUF2461 domain-containing protein n=1 Tax=Dongshaea marina TaxID=2047966 RepID=UPI000D3E4656|nr:DUF2461 domain-containing protein [Dongshaea marina]